MNGNNKFIALENTSFSRDITHYCLA